MEWRAPPDGDVLSARLRGLAVTHCWTPEVSPSRVARSARVIGFDEKRRQVRRPRSTVGNSPSVRGAGSSTAFAPAYLFTTAGMGHRFACPAANRAACRVVANATSRLA